MPLGYAGLGDLLEPVADRVLAALTEPLAADLAAALLLRDGSAPSDPLVVARATLAALRDLAAESPVVVAVDDGQWLDPASARALAFAVRRLTTERVGVLLALRAGAPDPLDCGRGVRRARPRDRGAAAEPGRHGAPAAHPGRPADGPPHGAAHPPAVRRQPVLLTAPGPRGRPRRPPDVAARRDREPAGGGRPGRAAGRGADRSGRPGQTQLVRRWRRPRRGRGGGAAGGGRRRGPVRPSPAGDRCLRPAHDRPPTRPAPAGGCSEPGRRGARPAPGARRRGARPSNRCPAGGGGPAGRRPRGTRGGRRAGRSRRAPDAGGRRSGPAAPDDRSGRPPGPGRRRAGCRGPRRAGAGRWRDRAGARPCPGAQRAARRGRGHRRGAARGGGRGARGRRVARGADPGPARLAAGRLAGRRPDGVPRGRRGGGAGRADRRRPHPGRGPDHRRPDGLDRGRPERGGLLPPRSRGCRPGAGRQPGPAAADRVRAAAHLARRLGAALPPCSRPSGRSPNGVATRAA